MRGLSAAATALLSLALLTGCGPGGVGENCAAEHPEQGTGLNLGDGNCAKGLTCIHGDNGSIPGTCLPPDGAACDLKSNDLDQCGAGLGCAPLSDGPSTCAYATACTEDAYCAPYTCHNGWCLLSCTPDGPACTQDTSCDLSVHACQ